MSKLLKLLSTSGGFTPSVDYPLKTSLVPTKGAGSATFTRATTAILEEPVDNLITSVKSGEARFCARRVENLAPNTGLLGGTPPTSWVRLALDNTITISDSNLLDNHKTVEFNCTTGQRNILAYTATLEAGKSYLFSALVENKTGAIAENVIAVVASTATISPTSIFASFNNAVIGKRVSTPVFTCTVSGTVTVRFGAGCTSAATGTGTISLSHPQFENVTGKSNQNPSEYVSNGVQDLVGSELIQDSSINDSSKWSLVQPTSGIVSISGGLLRVYSADGTYANATPNSFNPVVGKSYICTIIVTAITGSGTVAFGGVTNTFTTTGTFTFFITATTTNVVEIKRTSGITDFTISDFSIKENLFHGANVDGVKYFSTYNGNTVASNVITEATGSKIPNASLKGVMQETASTNLLQQSEDFNTTWVKNTGITTVSTNVVTAPNGTLTADKLIENTTVGGNTYISSNSLTLSGLNTISVYAKSTGENRYLGFAGFGLGGSGEMPVFNLDAGTVDIPTTTTVFKRAYIEALPNGWYRCIATIDYTGTNNLVIAICNSPTDNSTNNYLRTGNGTSGVYVWGAQLEAKPMATTYIPTTTASVTRNADVLTFPNAGNVSDTQGTVLLEATPYFDIPSGNVIGYSNLRLMDFGSVNGNIYIVSGNLNRYDGTTALVSPPWSPLKNITYKIGSRYGSAGQRNWLNGTAGTNGAFDGSINSGTNMTIGGLGGNSTYNWGGYIGNIRIYKKALNDTKITENTTIYAIDENGDFAVDENGNFAIWQQ